jgi:hypothetical protein
MNRLLKLVHQESLTSKWMQKALSSPAPLHLRSRFGFNRMLGAVPALAWCVTLHGEICAQPQVGLIGTVWIKSVHHTSPAEDHAQATSASQSTSKKPSEISGKPNTEPQQSQQDQSSAEPKSLDELLGVPTASGDGSTSADDAATRAQQKQLDRSLDEAGLDDLVQRALEGMKSASQRLENQRDPGLGTQRIQEDVVKTLNRLLEEAQKQQQQNKSGSSSRSKKSSGKQQSSDPSESNGQQRGESQGQSEQRRGSRDGDPSQATDGQSGSEGSRENAAEAALSELAETRIEWGQLPERIRELVLQGRRDRVSSLYERMTREYYRRLAEEASR